jgi:hypothetical protein
MLRVQGVEAGLADINIKQSFESFWSQTVVEEAESMGMVMVCMYLCVYVSIYILFSNYLCVYVSIGVYLWHTND